MKRILPIFAIIAIFISAFTYNANVFELNTQILDFGYTAKLKDIKIEFNYSDEFYWKARSNNPNRWYEFNAKVS